MRARKAELVRQRQRRFGRSGEMSEEITKVIDVLAEKLAVPAQFVTQELLRYKLAESVVWLVFGTAFLVAGLFVFKYASKSEKDCYGDMPTEIWFISVFGFAICVVGGATMMKCFDTIVKILVAPTGYIITYILGALK
jgi:lipid-A-disaccharide synthase-like uncharacterized protein